MVHRLIYLHGVVSFIIHTIYIVFIPSVFFVFPSTDDKSFVSSGWGRGRQGRKGGRAVVNRVGLCNYSWSSSPAVPLAPLSLPLSFALSLSQSGFSFSSAFSFLSPAPLLLLILRAATYEISWDLFFLYLQWNKRQRQRGRKIERERE